MEDSPTRPAGTRDRFVRSAGLLLFALVLRQTAWLCDDAYITFRTLDNIVNGFGPTWNPSERVQGYTHPLWMISLIIPYAVSGPFAFYYTCIVISMALSIAAAAVVCLGIGRTPGRSLLAAVLFCASKSFTEYSTSGLENPLTHLLLGLFLLIFLRPPQAGREPATGGRELFALGLLACTGWLNRMDSILLFGPALAVAWAGRFRSGPRAAVTGIGIIAAAFLPALLWVLFSTFYYGFPFPNTAYAKLNHGIPPSMLIGQSVWYFANSLSWDTITLPVIAIGAGLGFAGRSLRSAAVAAGIALYLLYVVKIGGDFMSGRFFAAPFFCAVALIVRSGAVARPVLPFALTAAAALSVLLSPRSVLHTDRYFGNNAPLEGIVMDRHLIADERMFYFQASGLLPDISRGGARHNGMPRSHYAYEGVRDRLAGVRVKNQAAVGFYGFFAGPRIYVIDSYALCNAFLARMPARRFDYYEGTIWSDYHWRIGHFERWLPAGYMEMLKGGGDRIADPELAEFHDRLNLVITGDLFAPGRFREIFRHNTGGYDHLLAAAWERGKGQWEPPGPADRPPGAGEAQP